MLTYILLFQCRDRKGIVARVSEAIFRQDGNILTADQYTTDPADGHFFMRVEFSVEAGAATRDSVHACCQALAREFDAHFALYDKHEKMRMGIFVSEPDHCLFDLLYLWRSGELSVDIPFVVSNKEKHRELVEQYRIPYWCVTAAKEDRKEEELLVRAAGADFLVLARYMLVLSGSFLRSYGRDIINIHHGFLPSFKGPDPYRQALAHGVKVIGATAHFVTDTLDEGPIISQAVEQVSHEDDLVSLLRKGKNLEKRALSAAVSAYIDHRVITHGNTTIVF
jgi:formyltetrahydrofolate deformylase